VPRGAEHKKYSERGTRAEKKRKGCKNDRRGAEKQSEKQRERHTESPPEEGTKMVKFKKKKEKKKRI